MASSMSMSDHLRDVGGFKLVAKSHGGHADINFGDETWVSGVSLTRSSTFLQIINPYDVMQGSEGNDCWFVASASLLAKEPARVKALFLPECDPTIGFYASKWNALPLPCFRSFAASFALRSSCIYPVSSTAEQRLPLQCGHDGTDTRAVEECA